MPRGSQEEVVYIYALCDPLTMRVRYVGKSNNPKERLSGHLSERSLKANNAKNAWIKSLLEQGLKPVMIILQEITHGCWAEAERAWICLFRMQGCAITNTSDGGEGILDQHPEARVIPRESIRRPPQELRKGGLIPRRPGRGEPRRDETGRREPRSGERHSRQNKNGTDRTHFPKPPRKQKPRTKGRKKSGA